MSNRVLLTTVILSGLAYVSVIAFCKLNHVHVNEISEFYAKKQQHKYLYYIFNLSLFVVSISLMFSSRHLMSSIKSILFDKLSKKLKKR